MTHLFIGSDKESVKAAIAQYIVTNHAPLNMHTQHPDLHLLEANDDESLGIDPIKNFFKTLHKKPFKAKVQLGIILGFDQATPEAQNASLKELEDHAERTELLIGTSDESALLTTIKSRATLHFCHSASVLRKESKDLQELAASFLLHTSEILTLYSKVSTKEWTKKIAIDFLHELYEQVSNNPTKELLALLQKASEYLNSNVAPKHVMLFVLFSIKK